MATTIRSNRATGGLAARLSGLSHRPADVAANLRLIREIGMRERVIALIDDLLGSESSLADVAARSYRHVNLFDKIVLVGNADPAAYRLTFHLWIPPYTYSELHQELIHEHRFDFWSKILTGTLRSETFVKDEAGKRYRRYRYVPDTARTQEFGDFYHFSGDQPLLSQGTNEKRQGIAYHLSAPEIHRIIPSAGHVVCTLVLRGPRLRSYSYVYNTAYPTMNLTLNNAMFTPGELAQKLATLREALCVT